MCWRRNQLGDSKTLSQVQIHIRINISHMCKQERQTRRPTFRDRNEQYSSPRYWSVSEARTHSETWFSWCWDKITSYRRNRNQYDQPKVVFAHLTRKKYAQFQRETANYVELTELSSMIFKAWPENTENVLPSLRQYWSYRGELTCLDGLLFEGDQLIVPKKHFCQRCWRRFTKLTWVSSSAKAGQDESYSNQGRQHR